MTQQTAHQPMSEAEEMTAYKYWRGIQLKINSVATKEYAELCKCHRKHERLMNQRKRLLDKKTPYNAVITIQLAINAQDIADLNDEVERRRQVLSLLYNQIRIAGDEVGKVLST
jgi:hypothetical protein